MADRNVVLVCGGRAYENKAHVWTVLDQIHHYMPITRIVHGGAKAWIAEKRITVGADYFAGTWAKAMGVPCTEMLADWKAHGRAAGPIRNQKMLDQTSPDYVIAFPGGSGTRDMTIRARANGYRVETHEARQEARIKTATRSPSDER